MTANEMGAQALKDAVKALERFDEAVDERKSGSDPIDKLKRINTALTNFLPASKRAVERYDQAIKEGYELEEEL
jgi:hypothetical protein